MEFDFCLERKSKKEKGWESPERIPPFCRPGESVPEYLTLFQDDFSEVLRRQTFQLEESDCGNVVLFFIFRIAVVDRSRAEDRHAGPNFLQIDEMPRDGDLIQDFHPSAVPFCDRDAAWELLRGKESRFQRFRIEGVCSPGLGTLWRQGEIDFTEGELELFPHAVRGARNSSLSGESQLDAVAVPEISSPGVLKEEIVQNSELDQEILLIPSECDGGGEIFGPAVELGTPDTFFRQFQGRFGLPAGEVAVPSDSGQIIGGKEVEFPVLPGPVSGFQLNREFRFEFLKRRRFKAGKEKCEFSALISLQGEAGPFSGFRNAGNP